MTVDPSRHDRGDGLPLADGRPAELLYHAAVLCRVGNHLRHHLETSVLRDERLTWAGYDVLQLTCGRRPIDARTISEVTGLARATITLTLKDLTVRQLIRRAPRPGDHRHWLLQPTAAGLQLNRALRDRLAAALAELLENPADTGQHDARVVLHRISRP